MMSFVEHEPVRTSFARPRSDATTDCQLYRSSSPGTSVRPEQLPERNFLPQVRMIFHSEEIAILQPGRSLLRKQRLSGLAIWL
jgi:hypothetical protein